MKKLNVYCDFGTQSHAVGQLYLSEEMGRYVFSYQAAFLQTRLELSPLTMPLSTDTYVAKKNTSLYDLHGVFADSLPDDWGKKVQDIEFEKIGFLNATAIDRLAFVGRYGVGALRYEPAKDFVQAQKTVELASLRKSVQKILSGKIDDVSNQLLHCGGSAGGARPKFLVDLNSKTLREIRYTIGKYEKDFVPIIIKVPVGKNDQYQRIEYAYSRLAKKAGICIPEVYLLVGEKSRLACFAIQRFDIHPNGERFHLHTLAGLLGIDYQEARLDYTTLLRTTQEVTRDHRHVVEAYRRMVFNFLGSNKDDHAKNFSFLMDKNGSWSLAPAYDIGFSKGESDLHIMAINGIRRNATLSQFADIAEDFDIKEWKDIIQSSIHALEMWPKQAKACGVDDKHTAMINQQIKANIKRIKKDFKN